MYWVLGTKTILKFLTCLTDRSFISDTDQFLHVLSATPG